MPHYMIIGGGITGLKRCFLFEKTVGVGRGGAPFRISVVEKSPTFGGKIHTIERDGFVIEKGPDSFLARKRPIIDLAYDLGTGERADRYESESEENLHCSSGKAASHASWLGSGNSDANDTIYEDRPYFTIRQTSGCDGFDFAEAGYDQRMSRLDIFWSAD